MMRVSSSLPCSGVCIIGPNEPSRFPSARKGPNPLPLDSAGSHENELLSSRPVDDWSVVAGSRVIVRSRSRRWREAAHIIGPLTIKLMFPDIYS